MDSQTFVVGAAHAGKRLDRFLQAMLPRMSRSAVQEAIASRVVLSSGLPPKPSRRLAAGETVTIAPRQRTGPPPAAPRRILERPGFVVVDKPAGMTSVPSARHPGADAASATGLAPAHRLDRFTSGCLLLTTTRPAAVHFADVFARGLARKVYAAIVVGAPERREWTCDAALVPDDASRVPGRMRCVDDDDDDHGDGAAEARAAATRFRVVAAAEGRALVVAEPATGRRHQVRVHLAAAGHPVVGDLLYGGDERDFVRFQLGQRVAGSSDRAPGRHLLHARVLEVPELDGALARAVAPWPGDFPAALIARWRDPA